MAVNIGDIWIGDYVVLKREHLRELQRHECIDSYGWMDCNTYGIVADCDVIENVVYVQLKGFVVVVDPSWIRKISIIFFRGM